MIGIYKITNKINQKCYVGKSVDIEERWKQHLSPYEQNRQSQKPLYLAMAKYGSENFSFEVLEECKAEELDEKEAQWIQKCQAMIYQNGYNLLTGGQGQQGENHSKHKLTEADVIDIRTRYANHERCKDVEALYADRIGHSGFSKIWKGETWKHVMPEVYTPENKEFHRHNTGNSGSSNGRALLSEQSVYVIRLRKKQGEKLTDVYKDYEHLGITFRSFENVWLGYNWKNVVV